MNPDVFLKRREKLVSSLNKNELVLIFGNDEPGGASRFLQNSHFFYFTGLKTPEAVLVMGHIEENPIDLIYIQRNIPDRIVWDGEKMYPDEVTQLTGIKTVLFLDNFEGSISNYLYQADKAYINIGLHELDKPLSKTLHFVKKVREKIPHVCFRDVNPLIRPLRQIKDETEVEAITESIRITWAGIKSIWMNARAGMMEYELEAMLHFEMEKRGCRNFGFVPIVAAGKNAATLHYIENNCRIEENQLVLLDVGASNENYSADITRTFPISGTFSDRQKEIYAEVLYIQKEIIAMIKPGVGMAELNKKTRELMFESLKKLNLITEESEIVKYYMHGIGHHLGLDVHDIGARDSILQEGVVITVEPGIYIPEEAIGVRIEDDVLVTSNGHKVLSDFIPKEIDELEKLLAEYKSHVITQQDLDEIAND
ncbi:MAG TPA: Xaa-Pro aminopeptidase [Candidatus Cloacimonadota bacterium]|nr:Xaa-Pro aminopeptidase [Candidatus Cloacimonadota bacterium]HPM01038.1 Xaa-Pro aminopeptidase [Candidatus Cloacimonadota bacterium]